MSERDGTSGEGAKTGRVGSMSEESWRRHLDILDLLKEIREKRGRKRSVDAPDRSRRGGSAAV